MYEGKEVQLDSGGKTQRWFGLPTGYARPGEVAVMNTGKRDEVDKDAKQGILERVLG